MYLGLKPLLEYELLLIRLELSPQWQLGPKGFPLLESVLVLVRLELSPQWQLGQGLSSSGI